MAAKPVPSTRAEQETRALDEFQEHFRVTFGNLELLKLALTHRSYLSVTGQGPRESNERLEFLGDSVLGLVTSEFLYRENPEEHEGDLTKMKSLLVSKAILSRRALAMGLGRFVLMSHSEVESGGRQRLSILADAFEAVIGAIYLDQGFEPAREFIHRWLLRESGAIVADKRHTNYKSHLQEYVQSTWRTHPVYRIRSEMGPDHSKHFLVEVLVGKRSLGEGRGRNKKEAEQAAARNALERAGVSASDSEETVEAPPVRAEREPAARGQREPAGRGTAFAAEEAEVAGEDQEGAPSRRRGRRTGRNGRERILEEESAEAPAPPAETGGRLAVPGRRLAPLPEPPAPEPLAPEKEPPPRYIDDDEEVGRPDLPHEQLHVDPYAWGGEPASETASAREIEEAAAPARFDEEEAGFEAGPALELPGEDRAAGPGEPARRETERRPFQGRERGRRGFEARARERREPEPQAHERRPIEAREPQRRDPEPRAPEPREPEPREPERREPEPRAPEKREPEPEGPPVREPERHEPGVREPGEERPATGAAPAAPPVFGRRRTRR